MAPLLNRCLLITCDHQFAGELSADALGFTVCLYSYSHLSFAGVSELADVCIELYHLLREYVFEHQEARAILGAID